MQDKDHQKKEIVAEAAADYLSAHLKSDSVIGIGSGSTVNAFIAALGKHRGAFDGALAASSTSAELLKEHGIKVYDLNQVAPPRFYVDGADEINPLLQMIKGGGGALTREKIIASASEEFICIATDSKWVPTLGAFPLAVEVLPIARGLAARKLAGLGGTPKWRQGFTTDNGNIILDVSGLDFSNPMQLERTLNDIPGAVCNGIFAVRRADRLLIADSKGVRQVEAQ
jgi:ribose 5-phosphate isomerase A